MFLTALFIMAENRPHPKWPSTVHSYNRKLVSDKNEQITNNTKQCG